LGKAAVGYGRELDGKRRPERQRFERRDEPALGEHRRMETARELAQLLQPGRELVTRELEQPCLLVVARAAEAADRQQHRHQSLLRAVVEVPLDAAALLVGDLHEPGARGAELGFGTLAVADVAK